MPWAGVIWAIIILFRLLGSDETTSGFMNAYGWLTARGRVAGQTGPDMRSFAGRAGRREWWVTMLWCGLIAAMVSSIPTVGPLLALPWWIGALAVTARRLHDMSLPAWVQIIPLTLALTILALEAFATWRGLQLSELVTIVGGTFFFFTLIAFAIWMGLVPGQRGSNCYGEADAT